MLATHAPVASMVRPGAHRTPDTGAARGGVREGATALRRPITAKWAVTEWDTQTLYQYRRSSVKVAVVVLGIIEVLTETAPGPLTRTTFADLRTGSSPLSKSRLVYSDEKTPFS